MSLLARDLMHSFKFIIIVATKSEVITEHYILQQTHLNASHQYLIRRKMNERARNRLNRKELNMSIIKKRKGEYLCFICFNLFINNACSSKQKICCHCFKCIL